MKKIALILAGSALVVASAGFYVVFGGAFGRISIPGPSHRFGDPVATACYLREPRNVYTVNLGRLLPYLKDADWSSDHWSLWKIPFIVMFRDGRTMKIDRLGGQYVIEGIPGVFSVTGLTREQDEAFSAELNAVFQEQPNQALVPTPASVTPAADAPVAPAAGAAHL
jgi:hypothetical protein